MRQLWNKYNPYDIGTISHALLGGLGGSSRVGDLLDLRQEQRHRVLTVFPRHSAIGVAGDRVAILLLDVRLKRPAERTGTNRDRPERRRQRRHFS